MQLTPMMQQYMNIKQDYPDCILFFRLGDFYEMFFEDALIASQDMEVTLTGKSCGLEERAPMCGVPYHAVDSYVAKLIDKGHKVAICEQMEDPATTKGIVKREVVRIITPGTLMNRGLLNEKESNYLAAVSFGDSGQTAGIAYCDLSTGEIGAAEYKGKRALGQLDSQIARLSLSELVLADQPLDSETDNWLSGLQCALTRRPTFDFSAGEAEKTIRRQFNVLSLEGLGLENRAQAVSALGGLLAYLAHTQKQQLTHLQVLKVMDEKGRMQLDRATVRNLELTETLYDKTIKGSLLGVLDRTRTAMGARLIRQWIRAPLNEAEAVEERLEAVSVLTDQLLLRNDLREALRLIYDLERLTGRIACGGANGRDMVALTRSLRVLPEIKAGITGTGAALLDRLAAAIADLSPAADLIESALVEEPPVTIKDGGLIRPGYSEPLDELKRSIADGQEWIAGLEDSERKRSGIRNLKVGFNRVFGYYIEVTKANLAAVPEDYIRKQTLVNSERYVTPQLKEVEANVLNAETRINQTEYELFQELRDSLQVYVSAIQATSSAIAAVDVLLSFAQVGADNGYVRPEISCADVIYIRRGRHPVLEQMSSGGQFVPNDTYIDRDEQNLLLITGPNMSGKSTYMRQTALIAMMAQCGCFVPAEEAKIGLIDRVYTRIGASDNLTQGQSTFFVEMSELANILNTATERSLVILDEIGRGTSTYDGLSIAFAVIEHLLHPERRTRTLFATHYHELTILEETLSGLTNLNVDVSDRDGEIVFLHRIVAGSASRSYGIHVAKLAGVPESVLDQADKKLAELENAPTPVPDQVPAVPTSVSADVASRIAAGEVVDRPVSIVKELVENAIDAGAGEISVEISDGGRNLIRVTDNGCGIPAEQVATAFLRHATSKVSTAEDLEAINTLGFRGEALASIAAVSETEIISRPPDQAVGKRLLLSGGERVEEGDTGCPAGTTILVTKLFFNTPARLKFLKNDRSEGALIVDLVSKLALAYPTIRFRMVHNQRPLFSTPGKGVVYDTVLTVYSMDIGRNLLSASRQDDSQGEITIYASPPEHTRPSRKYQIFFVNGRYIKSPLLNQAVAQAYTERLPEGKHPVVLLFLDLKPELIDVNVHPHKREIKFSEPEKVKSLVVETIRQILARPVSVTAADRKTLSPTTVDASVKEAKAIVAAEQVDIKSLLSTKRAEAIKKAESIERAETIAETAGAVYAQKPEIPPHETPPFDILSIRLFGSLFGSYLTGADDLNFYLIDQHAAHERIMYETLLKSVAGQAADRQLLLVPQRVEVPRRALIDADNWLKPLQQMGFDLEPFGSAVYLLRAVPAILDLQEAEDFLEDYLETADDSEKYQNPERLQKIISRSCQAAIKANRQLDKREAERLLQDLALCDNPYSCPHGRPTIVRQSKKDIEKWFQRT